MHFIPYARQSIDDQDIAAVVAVLKADWLTQGPAVVAFEKAVAEYCGTKYAVAVNSATSALHVACLAAGVGAGTEVWTSPNTFVASANCALYCGGQPDFVDIDDRTYNMDVAKLEEKLRHAADNDKLPKVVIPVHFAGQSCEMRQIGELSRKYGFTVIEDASHAIGGGYEETKIGSCQNSDMTVFSFHPVKIITSGEGGMVLTNREDLHEKLLLFRSHGITRQKELMQGEPDGEWYYQQITLGFNYRMTDIQAALGKSQLARIDEFVRRRHVLAARYNEGLRHLPLRLPWQHPETYSAFHLYVARLKLDELAKSRRTVFAELRAAGIAPNVHYIPVHSQPYYRALGFKTDDFPVAERYYQEALSLPLYFGLTDEDQDFVIDQLAKVLS